MGNHDAVLVRGTGAPHAAGPALEEHAHQLWVRSVVPAQLREQGAR